MKINKNQWIAIIIVLLIISYFLLTKNSSTTSPTNTEATSSANVVATTPSTGTKGITTPANKKITEGTVTGKCNFVVTFPKANQAVTFPLTIVGYIDQTKSSSCVWNQNLSRAGSVGVSYDANGSGWQMPGIPVPIMTNGSLGTAQSTSTLAFAATVNLQAAVLGVRSGTPIKLTFTELDVNNAPNPDQFDLNLYLK